MNISVSEAKGKVPVTILKIDGQLDGQTYEQLITKAQELSKAGAQNYLLDLADLTYISSAGLVALHTIALLTRGEHVPDTSDGWSAYRSMGRSAEAGPQEHIKLLNPRPEVKDVLDMVGFGTVFQVYTDLDEAVNSFS